MPTYGETRTKFKARLNRRDCTDGLADGFLTDSVRRIQRNLRVPTNEKSVIITVDATMASNNAVPVPADFLQIKDITYTSTLSPFTRVLRREPLEVVLDQAQCGIPGNVWCYARRGTGFIFGPQPLSGDTVRIDYYSEYEDPANDADETILLEIAEDLVIFGALSYAADHWSDKRGPGFEQRFVQILSDIQQQGDVDETAGNAVVQPAFFYEDDWPCY